MRGKSLVKRGLLAFAFVGAIAFGTLGAASDAEARGCRARGGGFYGGGFYAAPARVYAVPRYNTFYGPRNFGHYGRGGGFYYGGRGVAFGVGW